MHQDVLNFFHEALYQRFETAPLDVFVDKYLAQLQRFFPELVYKLIDASDCKFIPIVEPLVIVRIVGICFFIYVTNFLILLLFLCYLQD